MSEKIDLLRAVPLFADLDERSLQAIAALTREIDARAGKVLVQEGGPADAFYVIVDGTVRVEREGRFVRSMIAGGFLGEIALIQQGERTATATCVTECRLLMLQGHEFQRLLETFPAIHRRVSAAVARRRQRSATGPRSASSS
ncbi:MAG TPA: cyclic nucleotide-binding domain-containing protein [Candidatus Limnocylindrales bacterium]